MSETTVLIVEDEAAIREMVGFALRRAGHKLLEASTGREGEIIVAERRPDIILLDWMLPDTSGIELLRRFRRNDITAQLPVIMLTARVQEDDKVLGLDAGADDYLTKPFSTKELLARIRVIMRRHAISENKELRAADLVLDKTSPRISYRQQQISAGPTEFKLLEFFMAHPNRVYSRIQLLDHIWGQDSYVEDRTVDVHVLRLRKILKPFGCDTLIQTIRGAGYRFSIQV